MNNSVNVWVVVGSLALMSFGAGCGGDDDGGGSGGSGTGGAGAGGGGTGGGGSGGMAGSASGGAAGSGTGGSSTGGTGTGGTGTGGTGTGGGGGTHQTCTDAGTKMKAMATKYSCTDNSAAIQTGCEGLYAKSLCVKEWEAMIACALALPESAWECGGKGTPDFKAGNCDSEKAAFDTCTP